MQQILTIPVSNGNEMSCLVRWPQLRQGEKHFGYVLSCKGIGCDIRQESAGRRSVFNRVMWQIEKAIVEQGFVMAYVSPTGYVDGDGRASRTNKLSLDGYINDVAHVASSLETVFGERLNAIGHSLGAYSIARLALSQHERQSPLFSSVALLSPPFSPREAIEKLAQIYTESHEPRKKALAKAIIAGANLWTMAGYLSFAARLQNSFGDASALVDELLAAPPLDELVKDRADGDNSNFDSSFKPVETPTLIVYGRKDPTLFPQASLSFAEKQTWQDFEARWKAIVPEAEIIGYKDLGHNFTTGLLELLTTALQSQSHSQPEQITGIADAVAKHFKAAYAPVK